jgi:predicted Zn-dependent protease
MYRVSRRPQRGGGCGLSGGRLLVGLAIAAFALISYFGSRAYNPVTDENQYVSITPEQEVALGLQAAPQMAGQHGGLDPDQGAQAQLDEVCTQLLQQSDASQTEYPFDCHLLADPETINAFAAGRPGVYYPRPLESPGDSRSACRRDES